MRSSPSTTRETNPPLPQPTLTGAQQPIKNWIRSVQPQHCTTTPGTWSGWTKLHVPGFRTWRARHIKTVGFLYVPTSLLLNLVKPFTPCVCIQETTSRRTDVVVKPIVKNGVRQGGTLSPLLLFGIGCFFGQHLCGAAGYADDIILLCPTSSGLKICQNTRCVV